MNTEEKRNRMICNRCNHIFNLCDATIETRDYCGVSIPEKKCPKCGGTFRAVELPKEFDIYLDVNNDERYYTYTNKRGN